MKSVRQPLVLAALAAALVVPAAGAPAQQPRRSDGERPVIVEVQDSGFDWGSAAIGATAAFGLVLLIAGAVLVLRPATRTKEERRRHV